MEKPPAAAADAAAAAPKTAEPKDIKKQVEFYFSDSNFPRDKFLRTEASKDPDGCMVVFVLEDKRLHWRFQWCVNSHSRQPN